MKKFFEFVQENFQIIIVGVVVLVLIIAFAAPFVYGLSTLLWRWALNPYMPC